MYKSYHLTVKNVQIISMKYYVVTLTNEPYPKWITIEVEVQKRQTKLNVINN